MSEEQATVESPDVQGNEGQTSAETKNAEKEPMIPKSRLDQEIAAKKEALERLQEFESAQKKAEKEAMAQKQEFEKLWQQAEARIAELEPYQQQMESIVAQTSERNKQRIESIPESMRSLVPDYEDPMKLSNWLDTNSSVFSKPVAPNLEGGSGSGERGSQGNGSAVTPAEIRAQAARFGVSPELLAQEYGVKLQGN